MTTSSSSRILLVFHSGEGQTSKVATRIEAALRDGGADVQMVDAADAPSPEGFDGVVAGDSIHAGRHSRELTRWVAAFSDELNALPVAVFQVSLTSATHDAEHTAEAHRLLHRLLDATGLDPDVVGFFAGALAYTRYGWVKRHMMRAIARREGEDTDLSRDHEYTDWDAVDHFATDVLALVTEGLDARGHG